MAIKKILVSQPAPVAGRSPYFDIAKRFDVTIDFRPLIHVERIETREFRDQKIAILDYSAIVFNTHHAIDHFFSMCKDMRIKVPETMKYFFMTEQLSFYIQKYVQYRKRRVNWGDTGTWDGLISEMLRHKKERYLIPQSDVHNGDVTRRLTEAGLNHTECVMYRTVSTMLDKNEAFDYDAIVFFTPSGVKSLQENFPQYEQGDVKFICLGAAAGQAITDAGFRLDLQAPTPSAPSLTTALEQYLLEQNGEPKE